MSYSDDLIDVAKSLCIPARGVFPTQAALKTAIHNCYQAVFHGLQNMCANELIGDETDKDCPINAWFEMYRALKHETLLQACSFQELRIFPKEFHVLGLSVRMLQKARHSANYNIRSQVKMSDAVGIIETAERCIGIIKNARKKDRLAFSAWIILDRRGGVADARKRARSEDPTALILKD